MIKTLMVPLTVAVLALLLAAHDEHALKMERDNNKRPVPQVVLPKDIVSVSLAKDTLCNLGYSNFTYLVMAERDGEQNAMLILSNSISLNVSVNKQTVNMPPAKAGLQRL